MTCKFLFDFLIEVDNDNLSVLRLNRDKSDQMLYNENRPISPVSAIKRNQKSPSRTALDNKLQQLEKKQYELTKKVNLKIGLRLMLYS